MSVWLKRFVLFGEKTHFEPSNDTFESCCYTYRASAVSFLSVGTPLSDLNDNQIIIMRNNDNRNYNKSRGER